MDHNLPKGDDILQVRHAVGRGTPARPDRAPAPPALRLRRQAHPARQGRPTDDTSSGRDGRHSVISFIILAPGCCCCPQLHQGLIPPSLTESPQDIRPGTGQGQIPGHLDRPRTDPIHSRREPARISTSAGHRRPARAGARVAGGGGGGGGTVRDYEYEYELRTGLCRLFCI